MDESSLESSKVLTLNRRSEPSRVRLQKALANPPFSTPEKMKQYFDADGSGLGLYIRICAINDYLNVPDRFVHTQVGLNLDYLKGAKGRPEGRTGLKRQKILKRFLDFAKQVAEIRGLDFCLNEQNLMDDCWHILHFMQLIRAGSVKDHTFDSRAYWKYEDGGQFNDWKSVGSTREPVMKKILEFAESSEINDLAIVGDTGFGKTTAIYDFLERAFRQLNRHILYLNCDVERTTWDVIVRVFRFMFGADAFAEALGDPHMSTRTLMASITQEIAEQDYLFIFDGLHPKPRATSAIQNLICNDHCYDFIRSLAVHGSRTKILISGIEVPPQLQDIFSNNRVHVSPQDNDWCVRYASEFDNGNKSPKGAMEELLVYENIGILNGTQVQTAISYFLNAPPDLDKTPVFANLVQGQLGDILHKLDGVLEEKQRLALLLLAIAEQGLSEKNLTSALFQLANCREEEAKSTVESLSKTLGPVCREHVSSDYRYYEGQDMDQRTRMIDINPLVKWDLLRYWERSDETRNLLRKREAHLIIAKMAREYSKKDRERVTFGYSNLHFQRHSIQTVTHLLASINPASLIKSGVTISCRSRGAGNRKIDDLEKKVFEEGSTSSTGLDRFELALNILYAEIEGYEQRALSQTFAADDIRLDLFRRLFHVGYSLPYPTSTLSGVEYPMIPSPPKHFDVLSLSDVIDIYNCVSESALMTCDFNMSRTANEIGFRLAKENDDEFFLERYGFTGRSFEILINLGQLDDAEFALEKEIARIENAHVVRLEEDIKHEGSVDKVNLLSTYNREQLKLNLQLAEVRFARGKLGAAGEAFKAAKILDDQRQQGMRSLFVGAAARIFHEYCERARMTIAKVGIDQEAWEFIWKFSLDEFEEFRQEIFNRHRSLYKTGESTERGREYAEFIIGECLHTRREILSGYLNKIPNLQDLIVELQGIAYHLPNDKLKLEVLKEEARSYLLLFVQSKQQHHIDIAVKAAVRCYDLADSLSHLLYQVDALLLLAEIKMRQRDFEKERLAKADAGADKHEFQREMKKRDDEIEEAVRKAQSRINKSSYDKRTLDIGLLRSGNSYPSEALLV